MIYHIFVVGKHMCTSCWLSTPFSERVSHTHLMTKHFSYNIHLTPYPYLQIGYWYLNHVLCSCIHHYSVLIVVARFRRTFIRGYLTYAPVEFVRVRRRSGALGLPDSLLYQCTCTCVGLVYHRPGVHNSDIKILDFETFLNRSPNLHQLRIMFVH